MTEKKRLQLLLLPYDLVPDYKETFKERGLRSANFKEFVKAYKQNNNSSPIIKSRSVFSLALKEVGNLNKYLKDENMEFYARAARYEHKLKVLLVEHYIYTYYKSGDFIIKRIPEKDRSNIGMIYYYNIQGIDTYVGFVHDLSPVSDFTELIREIAINYNSISIGFAKIIFAVQNFPLIDIIYIQINEQEIARYFKSRLQYPGVWKIAMVDMVGESQTSYSKVNNIADTEFHDYFFEPKYLNDQSYEEFHSGEEQDFIEGINSEQRLQERDQHDREMQKINLKIDEEMAQKNQYIYSQPQYSSGDSDADNALSAMNDLDNQVDQVEQNQLNENHDCDHDVHTEDDLDDKRIEQIKTLTAMAKLSILDEMKIETISKLTTSMDSRMLHSLIEEVQYKLGRRENDTERFESKSEEEQELMKTICVVIEKASPELLLVIKHTLFDKILENNLAK